MSIFTRMRQASTAVLVGVGLRVFLGLGLGLVPAAWATETTRHFPRGELALAEHGSTLLLDLFAHGSLPHGSGRLALFLGLFSITLGLVPFGATILGLHERDRIAALLARTLARMGTLLLVSGVVLIALALVLLLEVMAVGPLVSTLGQKSLVAPALLLTLAIPAPAAFALYGDALRVRAMLADDSFIDRFAVTLRCLRGRGLVVFARYLLAASLQAVALGGAAALSAAVIAQPTGLLVMGLAGAALLLIAAAFTRAWLLAHLVVLLEPGAADVEALQGPRDVGYEAASTSFVPRPDSSVGRAED
jgi:hypothetical protein